MKSHTPTAQASPGRSHLDERQAVEVRRPAELPCGSGEESAPPLLRGHGPLLRGVRLGLVRRIHGGRSGHRPAVMRTAMEPTVNGTLGAVRTEPRRLASPSGHGTVVAEGLPHGSSPVAPRPSPGRWASVAGAVAVTTLPLATGLAAFADLRWLLLLPASEVLSWRLLKPRPLS